MQCHQLHSLHLFLQLGKSNTSPFTRCTYLASLPRATERPLSEDALNHPHFKNTQWFDLLHLAWLMRIFFNFIRISPLPLQCQ